MPNPTHGALDRLTDAIVKSYRSDRRTQRIGAEFLPGRDAIVEIIHEIRELLFPGYFGRLALTAENARYHVGNLLIRLCEQLTEQIYHCLCYGPGGGRSRPETCMKRAGSLARKFLRRIPHVREMLALDAQATHDGDPAAKGIEEVIYCYPGFYAITVYRVAHELAHLEVPLMGRIMAEHAHSVTGTDIHPGATIGRSFFIDHATGVVIGETTRIGDNVRIYQGVTLGALSFPKDERGRIIHGLQRHPTIRNNVTIYANATILGGRTVIGTGATIGANSFITEPVPPRSVVGHTRPEVAVRGKRRRRKS